MDKRTSAGEREMYLVQLQGVVKLATGFAVSRTTGYV